MSQIKRLLPLIISGTLLSVVYADSQRTMFTVENQFPRWEQFEVGATYESFQTNNDNYRNVDSDAASAYVRYGILDNLAAQLEIPFLSLDYPNGQSESGLGDMSVGFQLRTYEDIFRYPYFIPHVSFTLPTGDEDKGLGSESSVITFGISYGSTINDWIDWALDVSYVANTDDNDHIEVANSYVWDISKEFALVTEVRYAKNASANGNSDFLLSGGFSYDWTERVQLDLDIGSGIGGQVDAFGQAKLSYSF